MIKKIVINFTYEQKNGKSTLKLQENQNIDPFNFK